MAFRPNLPDQPAPWLRMVIETCDALVRENMPWRGQRADPELLAAMLVQAMTGGTADTLRAWLRASDEYKSHQTPTAPSGPTNPPPPTNPQPPAVRVPRGNVVHDKHVLGDAEGPRLFLGTSFFWALGAYIESASEAQRVLRNFDFLARHGVDYYRLMATWDQRNIDPARPEWEAGLRTVVAKGFLDYGLRAKVTCFAGAPFTKTAAARLSVVDRVAAIVKEHPERFFCVEVANESYSNGPDTDEARMLARRLQSKIPNLVEVSAPRTDADADVLALYGGNVGSMIAYHFDRSFKAPDNQWRPVRQPWREAHFQIPNTAEAMENAEPIGDKSSVNEDRDPTRLALAAVVSWLCGIGAHCVHTGAGVRGLPNGVDRGREANLFDVASLAPTLDAIDYARSILDPTIPNWSKHNGHWSSAPLHVNAKNGGVLTDYAARIYHVQSGKRILTVPVGIRKPLPLSSPKPARVRVFDIVARQQVRELVFQKDEVFTIADNPKGVVILAEYL